MSREERSLRLARLRSSYPTFCYESFAWREEEGGALACSFRFRAGEHVFEPSCTVSFGGGPARARLAPGVMDNLVFHLGLAELPSYWKAFCSPRVDIAAGSLSAEQIAFWSWIFTEGMGEFHYTNQTSFTDEGFVTLEASGPNVGEVFRGALEGGYLVPVGGGKDSLVTLDLLGSRFADVATLAINPPPSTEAALDLAGASERVTVTRRLDPRLLALNEAGHPNGHTPFGVVVACLSALAAVVTGKKYVSLSNEASADFALLVYRGATINHQFGKSWALEQALHRYLSAHVAKQLRYFSLLRPFNELQIAQRFARLTPYHAVFRSCNRGRKSDDWCGRCPKCVSTFVVLAPFMERARLTHWLGGDRALDSGNAAVLASLLSEDAAARPFECVAAPDEIRAALALSGTEPITPETIDVLTRRNPEHLVPAGLYPVVEAALRARVSPLLPRAKVAVLGLGREGASTVRWLLANAAPNELVAVDDDERAAERLPAEVTTSARARFMAGDDATCAPDIVFKSPGVPPEHPLLAVSRSRPMLRSANTELFFERRVGTVVGVTGTKGKSTTTSLIAHVLAAAGKDARLVGNIGTPCLDGLAGADAATIFCVELSSFQLEGLRESPDLAVVLGIFGDHFDRYGDLSSYVEAKAPITRFQTKRDVVFYNAECSRAMTLAAKSPGRKVPFTRVRPDLLGDAPSPLLGSFNNLNLWPAILVGRHFGLEDAAIARAVRSFRPLSGRLETVADKDGVRFVCDIRSTAPEVTVAALEALSESGEDVSCLFLGGVDRDQDYRTLLPALERSAVRHIVLFPPTGSRIREVIEGSGLRDRFTFCEPVSMEEAVRFAYRNAPAGRSVCLMSTAAPSNGGLFAGPEDKTRQLTHWANALGRPLATP